MDMDNPKMHSDRVAARLLATELTAEEVAAVSGAKGGGTTGKPSDLRKDTNYS